jgi:Bacterial regulatory proteins, gntR family
LTFEFPLTTPGIARLTEEALAAAFNVSRTTIRQVIARLAQDGILVKLPICRYFDAHRETSPTACCRRTIRDPTDKISPLIEMCCTGSRKNYCFCSK